MKIKKVLSRCLVVILFLTLSLGIDGISITNAAVIDSIPNTTRGMKAYDNSYLSVTGYASLGVNDRSSFMGTSYYREVKTEREFLQAILDASNDEVKVIEVVEDLNLGWNHLNLTQEEIRKYNFLKQNQDPVNGFTNPNIISSGVSELRISNTDGLTIFSTNGKTLRHVEVNLQRTSKDIIIRNLHFDGMWQWDDTGDHKEVGWGFIVVNGANNVWIDHCTFSIASDGLIDVKNGGSNITVSWSSLGLKANENPAPDSDIYQSINFMEEKYNSDALGPDSLYYKMRSDGATKEQIMAYAAYHSKGQLNGSGDKDYVNYVRSNGEVVKDGNQRIRLTIAYTHYHNVRSRIPMIRQGVGHLYNCYIDHSSHSEVLDNIPAIARHADGFSRALNARNGASIAADTCVFNEISEPITGAEIQGLDIKNMPEPWGFLFQNAYNNNLIVNSKVTNKYGTYTGSSWDNNGENLFTKGFEWHDKSSIGNWAWSSHIIGSEEMSKENPPTDPFTFEYRYDEKLPYHYNVLPLESVVPTVKSNAGAGKIEMSSKDWLKTEYPPAINDLIDQVEIYNENGEIINERATHSLRLHLIAVKQFEEKQVTAKVVKHMEGFKILLEHYYKINDLTKDAYEHLHESANLIISHWQ